MERFAGDLSAWLVEIDAALAAGATSTVPCDGCTACCTAAHFVDVGPDEADTLAHIPAELLFPAPGRPPDHRVLGYDANGHCPMLVEGACSIYEHRPRACRTYDCRIYAATAVTPPQPAIADRVQQWRFAISDEREALAIRAAAAGLAELPDGPRHPTELALRALTLRDLWADGAPAPEAVAVRLAR